MRSFCRSSLWWCGDGWCPPGCLQSRKPFCNFVRFLKWEELHATAGLLREDLCSASSLPRTCISVEGLSRSRHVSDIWGPPMASLHCTKGILIPVWRAFLKQMRKERVGEAASAPQRVTDIGGTACKHQGCHRSQVSGLSVKNLLIRFCCYFLSLSLGLALLRANTGFDFLVEFTTELFDVL